MNDIYARAAADVAREAGQFLKHFSDSHHLDIEHKGGDYDFVTNADRQSQALIAGRLRAAFPEHRFVGEEDGLPDGEVARRLSADGDDYCWVCDPLDGTINYIHHLGVYAVSVGLVHRGQSIAGAIYLPERDALFCAARGEGATLNGRPIAASGCASLREAFVTLDMPQTNLKNREWFLNRLRDAGMAVSSMRMLGSACHAIAMTACGEADAYLNLGLHAWDVAAGIVILEEAGGAVSDIWSDPFQFDMKRGFIGCAPGLKGAFREVVKPE